MKMWVEFDTSLIRVSEVKLSYHKIAGVEIPELEQVIFEIREFDVYVKPKWFLDGIAVMKDLLKLVLENKIMERKQKLLEYARRKTTQKVNLYEKVQIPAYQDAIRKIKRYLEDEDNLAKAAQKIVKNRQQEKTEAIL
jgi:V/A-type H+/Na+-transporting ATPase subunit D